MTELTTGNASSTGDQSFTKTIHIDAPSTAVWETLTNTTIMPGWMSDAELHIETDWQVGGPIRIYGDLHGILFENRGTVLQFEPEQVVQYTHLSSLSNLPDQPESYTSLEFQLAPAGPQTALTLTLRNFPTEAIYKHLVFYWNVALEIVKKRIEKAV